MAGFPKDGVGYYKAWWLDGEECASTSIANNVTSGNGNGNGNGSSNAAAAAAVSLSISPNDWTAPVAVHAPINVIVTTCAAAVQLYLNGVPQGAAPQPVERFGYAEWTTTTFEPGNLTAVGYGADGKVLAVQTILTAKAATHLELWIESPYGGRDASHIAADGQDAALLGVRLVDADGVMVPNADVNVTFTVNGPADVIGVHNGDPAGEQC